MGSKPLNLQYLDARRRMLKMSYAALAKRSGVSAPTVFRILSGKNETASFASIRALAQVLGLDLKFEEKIAIEGLQEKEARRKAEHLVKMVQGTSGLEGQAVSQKEVRQMVRQTVRELLAGSKRKLWSE
jgi:transcriptional regulator with XRE-family HTH domain